MTDAITLEDLQIRTVGLDDVYLNGTDLVAFLTRYFLIVSEEAIKAEYAEGYWAGEGIRNLGLILLDAIEATENSLA